MPALSVPNALTWRTGKPHRARGYAYIHRPTVVFAARVNMATVTYPLTSLTFDTVTTGAYGDIKPGMTLFIGSSAGASDKGRQRVRASATSSTIPIGRTSKGKDWGTLNVSDNDYITVLDLYEVWAKIPYITATGVSYKDETSFASNIAQPPVANGGPAVAGFVSGNPAVLTVNFTGTSSFAVDSGAGAITYAWDFKDGTPSTASTGTVSGVTFPAGFRYVSLTVSDGTRSHTTRIPVYAAARSGASAPLAVNQSRRSLKPEGQNISFSINATEADLSLYPPGTLVLYFEEEWYGATKGNLAGTSGREAVKFVGWLDEEPSSISAGATGVKKTVELRAVDVATRLARLPGFGQIVKRKTSPANWQEMKDANIDRYIHHLLHWHSTALDVAPFTWSGQGSTYPFTILSSEGANLYQQVDQRARAIAHRLVCTSNGELAVKADPQRLPTGNRTSTVIAALAESDWSSASYVYTSRPAAHWIRGSAIIASASQATPVFSVAPGTAPGQGESEQEIGTQLVTTQAELNARTGHDYARTNNPLGIWSVALAHGGDARIEPAYMEWVQFGVSSATAAQRKLTVVDTTRWLVMETEVEHDAERALNRVSIKIEPETSGFDAQTYVPPQVGQSPSVAPYTPMIPTYPTFPEDPTIIFPGGTPPIPPPIASPTIPLVLDYTGNIVLIATASKVWFTRNFRSSASPTWVDITPTLGTNEVIQQAIWSGFGSDAYVLVNDGTNSRVFYTDNAVSSEVSWTASASMLGLYSVIRATSTQGEVYIYGDSTSDLGGETWEHEWDFTADDFAAHWTLHSGVYTAGVGYQATYPHGLFPSAGNGLYIYTTFSPNNNLTRYQVDMSPNGETIWDLKFYYAATWDTGGFTLSNKDIAFPYPQSSALFGVMTRDDGAHPLATVSRIKLFGEGADPFADTGAFTRYSDDYGATFATAKFVGTMPAMGGLDTIKIGAAHLTSSADQTRKATVAGGDYSDYGTAHPQGALWIPYYTFGSLSNKNISTTTPEFLLASSYQDSGESVWKVTAGPTFGAITPAYGGYDGLAVSPNCIVMPWRSGIRLAAIFSYNGTYRLTVSTDTGLSWSDKGALTTNAKYIRMRKSDLNVRELYFIDGGPCFSPDFGTTIVVKGYPVSDALVSIEVLG